MFWPDLAWIIQPLSGEYAGRRALLERIPFVTGYGVELAMLVDIAEAAGVEAIAQVDLETRVHRNQSIRSLSRMSFGILQAALGRLERQGRLKSQAEPRTTMLQFLRRRDQYEAREVEVRIEERPPMLEVPEYQNRR
jgi:glucosyl-3-phosphoglycerate synthase